MYIVSCPVSINSHLLSIIYITVYKRKSVFLLALYIPSILGSLSLFVDDSAYNFGCEGLPRHCTNFHQNPARAPGEVPCERKIREFNYQKFKVKFRILRETRISTNIRCQQNNLLHFSQKSSKYCLLFLVKRKISLIFYVSGNTV